jgi:hypothetical protein
LQDSFNNASVTAKAQKIAVNNSVLEDLQIIKTTADLDKFVLHFELQETTYHSYRYQVNITKMYVLIKITHEEQRDTF